MSGLFGSSSGGGKNAPEQVNVPAFTSSGGITPQQDALGQYTYGEQLVNQASIFGGEGLGDSTMATQGAEGAKNLEAQTMAGMSDTNQGAEYDLYQHDLTALQNQLTNDVTLNQGDAASLGSLANAAGFTSRAGFGSGTSTSTNTTTGQ